MTKATLTMAAFCLWAVSGCATPAGSFAPLPSSEQASRYSNGVPVTTSHGRESTVMLGPLDPAFDPTQRLMFFMLVANEGVQPVLLSPERLTVTANTGARVEVFSAERLQKEAQDRAASIKFGAAMSMLGNSLNASSAGTTTTSGNVSGYGSSGSFYGNYNATSYNSTAAAAANAQASAANRQIATNANAQANAVLSNSQVGALQRQTIDPGNTYTTPVTIGPLPAKATELVFRISVGADVHEIRWAYVPQ